MGWVLPRSGALLRQEVTSKPSSLFSLFFPEIYSERHPLCRRNPLLRPIGSRKKQRRVSLLFAVLRGFDTHRNPGILLTHAIQFPRTTAGDGPYGPPCFCRKFTGIN
jgi:hypothetical protein